MHGVRHQWRRWAGATVRPADDPDDWYADIEKVDSAHIDVYAIKAYTAGEWIGFAMLGFRDQIGAIEERSSERMSFRTKPRIKHAIQQAAALSGVDDSVFTMNAAYRSAIETIAAHERTVLQPVDHQAFFAALDAPPAPTDRLRAAFARHRETITSK